MIDREDPRRLPAHVHAIYVPGIWLQAHHLDLDYYDENFRDGYRRRRQAT